MDGKDTLRRKIGRESLTFKEIQELLGWDNDNTMRKRFARFCALYGFELDDFKQGGKYRFDPEWHDLLLILLAALPDHPQFNEDQRKQATTAEQREQHQARLRDGMDEFLREEDRLDLETEEASLTSFLEEEVVSRFDAVYRGLIAELALMPKVLRLYMIRACTEDLLVLRRRGKPTSTISRGTLSGPLRRSSESRDVQTTSMNSLLSA